MRRTSRSSSPRVSTASRTRSEDHLAFDVVLEGVVVGAHEVPERGAAVGAGGLVEAGDDARRALDGLERATVDAAGFGDLFGGRVALEVGGELPRDAVGALGLLGHLHGDPDGVAVLLDGALQGLADPPRGVGREAEAALPVELVDGAHQAEGPLLDEVAEVDAPVLVPPRPVDDQAEVGRDHLAAGLVVSGRDALGQLDLLLVIRQGVPVEIIEKQPDAVMGACGVRHRSSSSWYCHIE